MGQDIEFTTPDGRKVAMSVDSLISLTWRLSGATNTAYELQVKHGEVPPRKGRANETETI